MEDSIVIAVVAWSLVAIAAVAILRIAARRATLYRTDALLLVGAPLIGVFSFWMRDHESAFSDIVLMAWLIFTVAVLAMYLRVFILDPLTWRPRAMTVLLAVIVSVLGWFMADALSHWSIWRM